MDYFFNNLIHIQEARLQKLRTFIVISKKIYQIQENVNQELVSIIKIFPKQHDSTSLKFEQLIGTFKEKTKSLHELALAEFSHLQVTEREVMFSINMLKYNKNEYNKIVKNTGNQKLADEYKVKAEEKVLNVNEILESSILMCKNKYISCFQSFFFGTPNDSSIVTQKPLNPAFSPIKHKKSSSFSLFSQSSLTPIKSSFIVTPSKTSILVTPSRSSLLKTNSKIKKLSHKPQKLSKSNNSNNW